MLGLLLDSLSSLSENEAARLGALLQRVQAVAARQAAAAAAPPPADEEWVDVEAMQM